MSDNLNKVVEEILLKAGVPKGIHRVALDIEVGADRYSPENINKLSKIDTFTEATQALTTIINNEKIAEVDNLRREFWRTTWTPYDPDSIFVDRIKELKNETD